MTEKQSRVLLGRISRDFAGSNPAFASPLDNSSFNICRSIRKRAGLHGRRKSDLQDEQANTDCPSSHNAAVPCLHCSFQFSSLKIFISPLARNPAAEANNRWRRGIAAAKHLAHRGGRSRVSVNSTAPDRKSKPLIQIAWTGTGFGFPSLTTPPSVIPPVRRC